MNKPSLVYKITKVAVDITLIVGIITCFLVPLLINYWTDNYNHDTFSVIELNIIVISSGIVAIYIVWQLRVILKNVVKDDPFTKDTMERLKHIALSTFIIACIYIIKLFLFFTFGTVIIVAVFLLATLLLLTLKDLFKQVLYYKEETDGMV